MTLSPAQMSTLKTDILADPALTSQPMTSDGAFAIAAVYNLLASPAYWVWRTSVTKKEMTEQVSRTGTTFTYVGNGFITRSAGEQTTWQQLFENGVINPALANVRQAITDILSGTGNAALNRTHMDTVARRQARRIEKLFAVGTGLDTTAGAGTMAFEGEVSWQDVQAARESA